ncbi:MAG: amino acid adenylation domain-containing protein [Roseivirga sp.]|nr:amino acid adenylation domain-containing protein [Roseivirga sp.]
MHELVKKLKEHAIDLDVVNDQLKLSVPEDFDAHEIIEEIRENKAGLIAFIKKLKSITDFKSIRPAEKKEYYVLTAAQRRLYFLYTFDKKSITYNMPQVIWMKEGLDTTRLNYAFAELINRHEILHTSFELINEEPVQKVLDQFEFNLEYFESTEADVARLIKEFVRPFDLAKAPLLRVRVVKRAEAAEKGSDQLLMIDMPHIVSDGVSHGILLSDFKALYSGEHLPVLPLQYKDYAEWQQDSLNQEKLLAQKDYWLSQMSGELPHLDLPLDYDRSVRQNAQGDSHSITFSKGETTRIKNFIREQPGITLFSFLLASFNVLLGRLSGQDDIIIGSPVVNRNHPDLEGIVGLFLNTLAFRNYPGRDKTFAEFLEEIRVNTLDAFQNQDYLYEDLLGELNLARDLNRNPLFDIFFNFLNFGQQGEGGIDGTNIGPFESGQIETKFDLHLSAGEQGDNIFLSCVYKQSLFREETIRYIFAEFRSLINQVVELPHQKIGDYDILNRQALPAAQSPLSPVRPFEVFTDEEVDQSLPERFARITRKYGQNRAVVSETGELSYSQLDELSNKTARALLNIRGQARPGTRTALLFSHDSPMIVAMLGTLKSGSAYVPADPLYPKQRIIDIIEDCGADVLLTATEHYKLASELLSQLDTNVRLVNIEALDPALSTDAVEVEIVPDALCYILYTSGSTGKPKGVMQSHRNTLHFCRVYTNALHINADDRLTGLSSYCHDASKMSIFGALLNGAAFYPFDIKNQGVEELKALIAREELTIYHSTPSVYRYLVGDLSEGEIFDSLRFVVLGGEVVRSTDVASYQKHFSNQCLFINGLGPTESTVTLQNFIGKDTDPGGSAVPVGYPVAHTQVHILRADHQPADIYEYGELVYESDYLALGYWNDLEKTNSSFKTDLLTKGKRYYKSGDMGRLLLNGMIEFKGRADSQVKIRGFRIELEEIENGLSSHPDIRESVVLVKEKGDDAFLVGYYVARQALSDKDIRNYLLDRLPDYMVPGHYVGLDHLPLTANGKVDTRALPEPEINITEDFVPPANVIEEQLQAIWADVLKLEAEAISVIQSFFELGGHSLRATVVVNRIRKNLQVEVPLRDFFRHADIRSLANYVLLQDQLDHTSIPKAEEKEHYALSSAQKRQYFLQQFDQSSTAYNLPHMVKLRGALDLDQLQAAFQNLIDRHESFRTRFVMLEEDPVQVIEQELSFELLVHRVEGENEAGELVNTFVKSFDLTKAPLLRAEVIEVGQEEHLLMTDMHHIISDGVSRRILTEELLSLYNGETLPALQLQYKDYSEWQQSEEAYEKLNKARSFWLDAYDELPEVLTLPTDHSRPEVRSYRGASIHFSFSESETADLKQLARVEGTTMFMLLLSTFNVLLSRLSNQQDIVVGTPTAGRFHDDLSGIIGMFVNTLPLRNAPRGDKRFTDFLAEVTEATLACFDHQTYQYEELINELKVSRDTSRNPLFDVMYTYLNMDASKEVAVADLQGEAFGGAITQTEKFDLSLTVEEGETQIFTSISYATDLFKRETVERFTSYFESIINQVLSDCSILLSEIDILSEKERHQLLQGFNDTHADYPGNRTVIDLFEAQVASTPDKTALIFGSERLSYKSFQRKVDQLTGMLLKRGVKIGDIVGLVSGRSIDMMVGIYGILKSGAAYLPIDPNYPEARIDYILQNSGVTLLLVSPDFKYKAKDSAEAILLDSQEGGPSTSEVAIKSQARPEGLAYVIYTSGSTGKPKGVMVEHGSLMNRLHWMNRAYSIGSEDVVLQKTPITFDVSVWELFWWSQQGSSLCLLAPEGEKDPGILSKVITQDQVSTIHFVPSMLQAFIDYVASKGNVSELSALRQVFCSGEALKLSQAKRFNELFYETNQTRLINLYGPTEATIDVSYYNVYDQPFNDKIPIGKPIDNIRLYVLGSSNSLQPIGVPGELCISGDGLSRGYLNNEKLTAEKFISSPFQAGERMYKTGDLARWLPDGNLEFLGRIDHQVKLRGFRIELGEIEHHLTNLDQVRESVVLARGESGDQYLVGYYVSEETLETVTLRTHLAERLPEYMVPSHYVHLEKLPLTANGKLDRKSLPQPEVRITTNFEAPANETEGQLQAIWAEVGPLGQSENADKKKNQPGGEASRVHGSEPLCPPGEVAINGQWQVGQEIPAAT